MKVLYPAIFTPAEEGGYLVNFPDVENCFSEGDDLQEAFANAEDVLGIMAAFHLEDKGHLPKASNIEDVHTEQGFVSLISVDLRPYLSETKLVNKTVTIPDWMNEIATRQRLNCSALLRQAILEQL